MNLLQINKLYEDLLVHLLNIEFILPNPETLIINILYELSGICDQVQLCSFVFFLQHHQC